MSWSETEVEQILARMRAGATVQTGGSRCHTTYFHRDGQWGCEQFDEGHTEQMPASEAFIRRLIAGQPELFRDVLAAPRWRRFSQALLAGDRQEARVRLRWALEYGDRHHHGEVLDAVLAWPEQAPSEEVVALLRSDLAGLTGYHVLMRGLGWDRSTAAAQRGVELADQVIAMVGEAIGAHYLRATFHQQAGDLAAAQRDMETELERLPADAWQRRPFEEQLECLRILAARPTTS
jgi:hypothetical protein